MIKQQAGFVGFLSLKEQEHADHLIIVTLWESGEAAQGWGQNPDYVRMAEEDIRPHISDWSITRATVDGAELHNVVV